jgi:hypothetical protein
MKSIISAAALFILLTPALAQQADQSSAAQAQPGTPAVEAASGQGMTQAQALAQAAAQDAAAQGQSSEQHPPEPEQPAGAQQSVAQSAPQQPSPSEPGTAPSLYPPQNDTAQSPGQSPAERRVLEVAPAVRPRAEAAAYPVYRQQPQLSIGAKLLSPAEVEKKFSTPIGKHYLVVEVGAFPADAKQRVSLRAQAFTLRAGNDDQAFFPATPEDIAGALAPKNGGRPRNVAFFPGLGVGYGRGSWGASTNVGVGVGVGGGGPRPYPRNAADASYRAIVQELRDKSLPEGQLTQPVAGYLFFPLNGKRAKNYNLELTGNGETMSLPLPTPKN